MMSSYAANYAARGLRRCRPPFVKSCCLSVPRVRTARIAMKCVGQIKARAQQVNLPGANSIYQSEREFWHDNARRIEVGLPLIK